MRAVSFFLIMGSCNAAESDANRPPGEYNTLIQELCGTTGCDCNCISCPGSPIIIDVEGDGYHLTDAGHGVIFDLRDNQHPQRWAWTAANSDDAFLVLDLTDNGTIDSGAELFGNFTPQASSGPVGQNGPTGLNGFNALLAYDGNFDGRIDRTDDIYAKLRLWQDANHDGESRPPDIGSRVSVG